jgi:hypothetical protein
MKRVLTMAIVQIVGIAMLALFATPAFAEDHFVLAGASDDHGTCPQVANDYVWAKDTYNLSITVQDNGDGTFALTTVYQNASFVTFFTGGGTDGQSPGGCQTETPHGSTVAAGVKGTFQAWVTETITSASYTPSACPSEKRAKGGPGTPGDCGTRQAFVSHVFGCNEDDCVDPNSWLWDYKYKSRDKSLTYNYWRDAWTALYPNEYSGDIAT